MSDTNDAPRSKQFLLAAPEKRVLPGSRAACPARVLPDHLTAARRASPPSASPPPTCCPTRTPCGCGRPARLLVVHWFGDTLDGTLARERKIERPRYGYYLDHLVDAVATAVIGIGLGLSPHMLLTTGLAIVVVYLVLSINVYLETFAFGVFTPRLQRFGPTEARLGLIGLNAVLALGVGLDFHVGDRASPRSTCSASAPSALAVLLLAIRAARNLRALA